MGGKGYWSGRKFVFRQFSTNFGSGQNYGYEDMFVVLLDYDGNVLSVISATDTKWSKPPRKNFSREFNEAKELFLRALETQISANTKIKVSEKLPKIAELTGDITFFEET